MRKKTLLLGAIRVKLCLTTMGRSITYFTTGLLIIASILSAACSSKNSENNTLSVTTDSVQPISDWDDFPSDEQWEQWQMNAFQPVIKRWLDGENLDGKFIELDWKDGSKWGVGMSEMHMSHY